MRSIHIVASNATQYVVEVDGVQIVLTKAMNKISSKDVTGLANYIDSLEDRVSSGESVSELRSLMNGPNMLRILEALFRDQIIRNWKRVLEANSHLTVSNTFRQYFGYVHNTTNTPSLFAEELFSIAIAQKKRSRQNEKTAKKEQELENKIREFNLKHNVEFAATASALELQNRAIIENWLVEKSRTLSNVVTFSVNGIEIDICLSGRPEFRYAYHVAAFLIDMEEALIKQDYSSLQLLVSKSGGKAAVEIMGKLFHDLSIQFFTGALWRLVSTERVYPEVHKFLKDVFGSFGFLKTAFGAELIGILEFEVPNIEAYLVESSNQEIHTDKATWKLFYYHLGRVFHTDVVFPSCQPLRDEMQSYLAHMAEPYINSNKPYAEKLSKTAQQILALLGVIDHRVINSVFDLLPWDFKSAVTKLLQQNKYSLSTIRRYLYSTRLFIFYYIPDRALTLIPSSLIPSADVNPTPPVDPIVFSQVKMYKDEIPDYIWLAFRVYEETGTRSNSVVNLSTHDLIRIDDRWALRIYNFKLEERHALSGVPNSSVHWISDDLGDALSEFISQTEELRNSFSKPYIFVYTSNTNRNGSMRRPLVLTNEAYWDYLIRFCNKKGIVNNEGIIQAPTARGIRAEVGRSMFADGADADEVSTKLGNTPAVAALHYNKEYPRDEANRRRRFYAETLDPKLGKSHPKGEKIIQLNTPMYGQCKNSEKCGNCNQCTECSERIVERSEKGG